MHKRTMRKLMMTQHDIGQAHTNINIHWEGKKWPLAPCSALRLFYLDKDSISHRINNFIARLTSKMNVYIFIFTAGPPRGEILVEQTDRWTK